MQTQSARFYSKIKTFQYRLKCVQEGKKRKRNDNFSTLKNYKVYYVPGTKEKGGGAERKIVHRFNIVLMIKCYLVT